MLTERDILAALWFRMDWVLRWATRRPSNGGRPADKEGRPGCPVLKAGLLTERGRVAALYSINRVADKNGQSGRPENEVGQQTQRGGRPVLESGLQTRSLAYRPVFDI